MTISRRFFRVGSRTRSPARSVGLRTLNANHERFGVHVFTEGRPYLDAGLGTAWRLVEDFVKSRVSEWTSELSALCKIAQSQPHASFATVTCTHGELDKWTYYNGQRLELAICFSRWITFCMVDCSVTGQRLQASFCIRSWFLLPATVCRALHALSPLRTKPTRPPSSPRSPHRCALPSVFKQDVLRGHWQHNTP